jgi:hypothetical protein
MRALADAQKYRYFNIKARHEDGVMWLVFACEPGGGPYIAIEPQARRLEK